MPGLGHSRSSGRGAPRVLGSTLAGKPFDMEGREIESCIERVYNGYSHNECGRKLKGDPEFPHLCGLHTSAIYRRRAKDEAHKQAVAARNEENAALKARINALADLGLDLKPSPFNDARVSVPLRQLEALADQVRALQQENLRRRLGEQ